jgi:hypothetical protein
MKVPGNKIYFKIQTQDAPPLSLPSCTFWSTLNNPTIQVKLLERKTKLRCHNNFDYKYDRTLSILSLIYSSSDTLLVSCASFQRQNSIQLHYKKGSFSLTCQDPVWSSFCLSWLQFLQ